MDAYAFFVPFRSILTQKCDRTQSSRTVAFAD